MGTLNWTPYLLRYYYSEGDSTKKNYNLTLYYFTKVAEQSLEDLVSLGRFYINRGRLGNNGFGITDDNKALKCFILAAEENSSEALYYLGELYSNSKQIPHDLKKALRYYQKSAELDYDEAQLKLGEEYITSRTGIVEKDLYESMKWFRKAAEQGNPTAIYAMTIILTHKFMNSGGSIEEVYENERWKKEIELMEFKYGKDSFSYMLNNELLFNVKTSLLSF